MKSKIACYFALSLLGLFQWNSVYGQVGKPVVSPQIVVERLYRDYAWEVLFRDSRFIELIDQSDEELSKYFSPKLVALMINDRACKKKTGDVCLLDFDPIYASQDRASVYELVIGSPDQSGVVTVKFRTSPSRPVVELRLLLKATSRGWRIDDVVYLSNGGASLKAILSRP